MKNNLPTPDKIMGGKYKTAPIAHYPNWAFYCPDCPTGNSYYELPQELPYIQEAYKAGTLEYNRPCGCLEGKVVEQTMRLWEVL
tara:strand:+ start:195 stop:446 length:252 start_codon:yes stop_codon:yes gene_type:complete